jgi:hypothetical protein
MFNEAVQVTPFLLSALTMGVVQVVKTTSVIPEPERFMPAVSLGIGAAFGFLAGFDIFTSIMVGLSASGLYDLGKKSVAGKVD